MNIKPAILLAALAAAPANAGPIAYGLCQTGTPHSKLLPLKPARPLTPRRFYVPGCNTVVVACYAAAGATFGTIPVLLAPPAILACNTALGTCSATCAALLLTPTP